jgi:uncharacterized protein (TIGR03663 family)
MYALALSTAMLLTTKETGFATLFVFISFPVITHFYDRKASLLKKFQFGTKDLLTSLFIFTLFSSFFTDVDGIRRSLISPLSYFGMGTSGGIHSKPFSYYLELLAGYELPLLVIGICAILFCFKKKGYFKENIVITFLVYWFLLTLLVYSVPSYKTPWIVINITLPMIMLSSYFLGKIYNKKLVFYLILLVIIVSGYSLYFTVQTSFLHFSEDEYNRLAYAHTNSDMYAMLSWLGEQSKNVTFEIQINKYDQWPLPWYFGLAEYNIGRDPELWDEISRLGNCSYIANLDAKKKIESRLDILGHPMIFGYTKELECLSAACYERKDYQLRNNYWVSVFYYAC